MARQKNEKLLRVKGRNGGVKVVMGVGVVDGKEDC